MTRRQEEKASKHPTNFGNSQGNQGFEVGLSLFIVQGWQNMVMLAWSTCTMGNRLLLFPVCTIAQWGVDLSPFCLAGWQNMVMLACRDGTTLGQFELAPVS